MGAIELMANGIEDEFLRLKEGGGVDECILPGQLVTVHGREDVPGVIAELPFHLCLPEVDRGSVDMEYMMVNTGHSVTPLNRRVHLGDLVSFAGSPVELPGDALAGHSLNNRASIVALTHYLEELHHQQQKWDVWFVATTREEQDGVGR